MSVDVRTLEARFYSAGLARQLARRHVAPMSSQLAELKKQEDLIRGEIAELQTLHAQQQSHADAALQRNKWDKVRSKREKRNQYGAALRDATERLVKLKDQIGAAKESERLLAQESDLYLCNQEYVLARHYMMRHIAEEASNEAVAAKRKYVRAAKIPRDFLDDLGCIWMYRVADADERWEIHLFYGGGLSPTGEGTSPDGLGHAHHLLRLTNRGKPILDYARYLDGHEYRRTRTL